MTPLVLVLLIWTELAYGQLEHTNASIARRPSGLPCSVNGKCEPGLLEGAVPLATKLRKRQSPAGEDDRQSTRWGGTNRSQRQREGQPDREQSRGGYDSSNRASGTQFLPSDLQSAHRSSDKDRPSTRERRSPVSPSPQERGQRSERNERQDRSSGRQEEHQIDRDEFKRFYGKDALKERIRSVNSLALRFYCSGEQYMRALPNGRTPREFSSEVLKASDAENFEDYKAAKMGLPHGPETKHREWEARFRGAQHGVYRSGGWNLVDKQNAFVFHLLRHSHFQDSRGIPREKLVGLGCFTYSSQRVPGPHSARTLSSLGSSFQALLIDMRADQLPQGLRFRSVERGGAANTGAH